MAPAKNNQQTPKDKTAGRKKAKAESKKTLNVSGTEEIQEQDLPGDATGRQKIKRQYEDLLGIRIEKLKGRILNREKLNKTIEGIYYICVECKRICHNLDEGLVQDPETHTCYCGNCRGK